VRESGISHYSSVLKPRLAKLNGTAGEGEVVGETQVDVRVANSTLPNGESVTGIEVTETSIGRLPNGAVLVETTQETIVVEEDHAAKERAKEAEKLAAAAAFYEQTKSQVLHY
jgi:hypothetical protein